MFFESLRINRAEPEDADGNLFVRAAEQTKILGSHNWLGADHAFCAEPRLEYVAQLLRQFRIVEGRRRGFAECYRWIVIFRQSCRFGQSSSDAFDGIH